MSARYHNEPYYDTAQICLNGHIITDRYNDRPQHRKNYCPKCGVETIYQCPNCNHNIQGDYVVPSVAGWGGMSNAPAYCHNCGQTFPWTKERLEAARELLEEIEELQEDKEKLTADLNDLVSDTPKTTVAATRWKRALAKVGEHSAIAFKEIFVEVASETAKKMLLP